MQISNRDLDDLFAAPPALFGTHMLLCGLSADVDTLERIMVAFTTETQAQRGASGMVRALLMLDASNRIGSPLAVPGMLRMVHRSKNHWTNLTSLMHAKVALLGFASVPFGKPTLFRLIVSTGNWTRASWSDDTQIDMYWSTECASGSAGHGTQEQCDIAAAFAFFSRMMASLYPKSFDLFNSKPLASGWLSVWTEQLKAKGGDPQFIHSIDRSLFSQIKKKFPKNINKLVAGSGFFEQVAAGKSAKPTVLTKLEELGPKATKYLVLNPANAGALAPWIRANQEETNSGTIGWTFHAPSDPVSKNKRSSRSNLHAKYIAGLRRVTQADTGTVVGLYIGSGNLSRAGLLGHARFDNVGPCGNVEAGICVVDEQVVKDVWKTLARGPVLAKNAIGNMGSGESEEILVALDPPPVTFAQCVQQRLQLVRSDVPREALQIRVRPGGTWIDIAADEDETDTQGEVILAIVWVRKPPTAECTEPEIAEVPVFSSDGALCKQAPPELSIDDMLEALFAFPRAPRPPEPGDPIVPAISTGPRASSSARNYPLHLMATLIEIIGRRNSDVTPEQFPFWLNQLRSLLLEQVTVADREAVRNTGVNLFAALFTDGFIPPWLDTRLDLQALYLKLVGDIETAWAATPSHLLLENK